MGTNVSSLCIIKPEGRGPTTQYKRRDKRVDLRRLTFSLVVPWRRTTHAHNLPDRSRVKQYLANSSPPYPRSICQSQLAPGAPLRLATPFPPSDSSPASILYQGPFFSLHLSFKTPATAAHLPHYPSCPPWVPADAIPPPTPQKASSSLPAAFFFSFFGCLFLRCALMAFDHHAGPRVGLVNQCHLPLHLIWQSWLIFFSFNTISRLGHGQSVI